MPDSKDLKDLDSQLKKTIISAESFKRGSSVDPSKNILNIQKTLSKLVENVKSLVNIVSGLEKIVNNNSKKITILKNISKTQSSIASGENIGAKLPGSSTSNVEDSIATITKSVTSIAEILAGRKKTLDNAAAFDRRKAEQEKRGLAEDNLEKRFEGLKSEAEKVISPVKSILDKIIDFFVTVFLGRVVYKLLEWFGDPKNADKVRAIGRFLGDHWPKLLALYITFGTSFGRFALGLTKAVASGAIKLGFAIAKLLAAKKVKGAMGAARFLGGGKGKVLAGVLGTGAALGGAYAVTQGLRGGGEDQKTQKLSGGGYVKPRFAAFSGGGLNLKGMLGGAATGAGLGSMFGPLGMLLGAGIGGAAGSGMFSGFVSGEKGVDKVPAMLTDGEFVMSTGAVQKYGVDTLEGMNAAGGGTNKPKIMNGTTYAAGGGSIQIATHHLKQDESLSSLTPGVNDYTNPKRSNWFKVTTNTPVYSYETGVSGDRTTIGWGSTFYDSILNGKKPVRKGDKITKGRADNILTTNISGLAKEYSTKIPHWEKMTNNQKASILIFGYNAPYGPIGAYPKITKALQEGDIKSAAQNLQRGGPNQERIALERRLLMSGPLNLKKLVGPKIVGEKKVGSGIPFVPPFMYKSPKSNPNISSAGMSPTDISPHEQNDYATKNVSPISYSKPTLKPAPKPPSQPTPKVAFIPLELPQGGGSGGGAVASTKTPNFGATAPGGSAKAQTLGVVT
jgi:GH24 family phage-related lysozyme (muramidase)